MELFPVHCDVSSVDNTAGCLQNEECLASMTSGDTAKEIQPSLQENKCWISGDPLIEAYRIYLKPFNCCQD